MELHGVSFKEYFTNLISKEVDVEPNNPAFRSFKNQIHVYPLSKYLLLLSMSFWIIIIGILFPWSLLIIWIPILYFIITVYALRHKRANCMWLAIIQTVLAVLVWAAVIIVMFITALFSTQTFLDSFGQGHHKAFIVRFLIVLMIKTVMILFGIYLIYQAIVFNNCRKYFDHIRNADLPRAAQDEVTELKVIQDKS